MDLSGLPDDTLSPGLDLGGLPDTNAKALREQYRTTTSTPDDTAKVIDLTKRTGLPKPVVERNRQAVERQAFEPDWGDLEVSAPITVRELAANTKLFELANDDTENMRQIERTMNRRSAGIIGGPAFDRSRGTVQASIGPEASFSTIVAGQMGVLPNTFERIRQGLRLEIADLFGFETVQQDAQRRRQQVDFGESLETPEFDSTLGRWVYGGAANMQRVVPSIAAGIVTRSPAVGLAAMGAQVQPETYGKYRARGGTPGEAALGSTIETGIEVGTEMLPMGFLVNRFGKAGATQFIAGYLGRELPTELVAEVTQGIVDTAIANPDKTWGEYVAELPDTIGQTVVSTLMMSGGLTVANEAARRMAGPQAQADAATRDADALTQISALAAASKLRTRDPQSFQEFVAAANEDGAVQDIYLDARTLQQAGIDPVLLAQASPSAAAQLEQALATGGDLVIPMSEYAARIAGTDLDPVLTPHLRTAEDALSLDEAQRFYQGQAEEFQKAATKVMEEKAADTAWAASAKAVETKLFDELKNAGRFTDDVNTAYSTLMRDFYVATASRLGITPEEMFARYPIKVAAERMAGDARRMEQGRKSTPTIDAGNGVVLHKQKDFKTDEGTFSVYDIEKKVENVRGRASMFTVLKDREGYIVRNAILPDSEKRKGVATALYTAMNAESLATTGKPLRSTQPRTLMTGEVVHELSDEGAALWDSFVSKGLAEKLGEKNYRFLPQQAAPQNPLTKLFQAVTDALGITQPQEAAPVEQPAPQPEAPAGPALDMTQFFQGDKPDLIVQHNLTAENLLHAVRMGGIPVPSLAITKKDTPLTGFGEITLLGSKDLADPKGYAGTKVFGADIYSPRYPSIEYQFTPNMKKLAEAKLKDGLEATKSYLDWEEISRRGADTLRTEPAVRWQFLKDRGIEPTITRVEPKPLPPALQPFANDTRDAFALRDDPAFVEAAYKAYEDVLAVAYDGDRAAAQAEIADLKKKAADRGVSYLIRDYAQQVETFQREQRDAGRVDTAATNRAIETQIYDLNLRDELEHYAAEFLRDINPNERIFQGYTYNGNRRYVAHTLENVVKILKKELRGGEGFNYGVGSIRSQFTPQFKSIKQIREAKDRLMDKAEFEKVKEEIDAEFFALRDQLTSYHPIGNEFRFADTVSSMMYDAATMGIPRALKENGFNEVPDEAQREIATFLGKLRTLPAEYFEAKILRDVDLTEFSGAVVPEGVTPKVIEALNARGVKDIRYYKKGDDADRRAKIGEFENLFFQNPNGWGTAETGDPSSPDPLKPGRGSRGIISFGRDITQTPSVITLFNNADLSTFLHEMGHFQLEVLANIASRPDAPAEIAADLDAVLKWFGIKGDESVVGGETAGQLGQPAYHGSPYKFDKFSLEHLGRGEGAQAYGWGLYFAGKKGIAEHYRQALSKTTPAHNTIDGKRITKKLLEELQQSDDNTMRAFFGGKAGGRAAGVTSIAKAVDDAIETAQENRDDYQQRLDAHLANPPLASTYDPADYQRFIASYDRQIEGLQKLKARIGFNKETKSGQLYEVDIPEEGQYLLWDKPLSEQPEAVKAALGNRAMKTSPMVGDKTLRAYLTDNGVGKGSVRSIVERYIAEAASVEGARPAVVAHFEGATPEAKQAALGVLDSLAGVDVTFATVLDDAKGGATFYRDLTSEFASDEAASKYLNSIGIAGIKYLDGTSRSNQPYEVVLSTSKGVYAKSQFATKAQAEAYAAEKAAEGFTTEVRDNPDATHNYVIFDDSAVEILNTFYQGDDTQAPNPDALPKRRTALEVWQAMSLEEKRPYHEQFARGFEAYLFEGKAPSQELTGLFSRFRAWLINVYKSVKALNVEISDDIRQVFDRLVATDEAIKQAEAMRSYAPMFPDDPEVQAAAAEATQTAVDQLQRRSLRDMQWLTNARGRLLKQMQKDAKAKRKAVEDEVRAEVRAMPIYAAMHFLKRGEMVAPDGEQVKVEKGHRLDTAALAEMYPESMLARPALERLQGMTRKDGLHPDLVAEMFGFTSGDQLVREIIAAENEAQLIEGLTDRRVLERYGDLADPDTLARAVDEAIHNEMRLKVLATELKAATKAQTPVRAIMQAAKDYAAKVLAGKKLKDIKPRQHAAAETRAGKAAMQAFGKGDTATLATEKRNQVLQGYLTKMSYEALDEVGKTRDFFRRVVTGKDDQVLKTRDLDVVNAARAILAAYGFGQKAKTAAEYLKVVQANDPEMYAVLKDRVDSAVADAKPFNELTLEEMRGLRDEIDAMWYLAKRNRQMEVDGDLLDRQEVQAALRERMEEIGIPDTVPGEGSAITPAEERLRKLQTLRAAARRVESWAEAKDGGAGAGPFWRYIWNTIKDPANRYRAEKGQALKALREAFDAIPGMQRGLIDAPELGYTFGKDEGGVGMSELMHALLHTGNESNKRKLLLGRKWATESADGTLNTARWDAFIERMHQEGRITKAHYDARQQIWDILESLKPQAQKAHRDVFGKYFAEVTAEAQVTPFGTYRGGYVPAIADTRVVNDAALRKLAEQENEGMAYAFPTTSKGFTKSRVDYNRPLLLDLRTLSQHIDKVLLFSHMEQPVRDVRRVLMSPEVSQALTRIDPAAYDGLLIPWLNRSAKQQVEAPIPGDRGLMRFVSIARQRAGMAAMLANVSNTAQQITGFSLAAIKVKPRYLLGAMAEYAKAPKVVTQTVAEASPYMATRMENEVAQMIDGINDILLDPSLYEKAQAWTAKHAYFMQSAVDNVMSPIVWLAAYNEAIEGGASELDAKRLADGTVRQTQGTTQPEDVSRIETGNAFWRLFAQFAGYFNMQANVLGTRYAQTAEELGVRKGAGRMLYITTFGFLIPAWVAEAIAQMFRGGPDDEDKDGEYLDDWLMAVFGFGTLRTATAMIPVAGQGINAVVNAANTKPYDDRIATAPAVSMIESAARAPSSVYKAIVDDASKQKAVRDVATLITLTTGLPASALARPVGYGVGVAAGEIQPENEADFARGVISGAKGQQR